MESYSQQHGSDSGINPKVFSLLLRHLAALRQQEQFEGVRLLQVDDPLDIQALVEGPAQTPYQGGTYRVKICIGAEFPAHPPRAVFLTRIFHPNISASGDVCVNTLKKDWDPQSWSIGHILQVIRCLLIVPFPESALNEEAGRLFMENYDEYAAYASMVNRVHATVTPPKSHTPSSQVAAHAEKELNGLVKAASQEDESNRRRTALKQAQQKTKKSLRRL